MSDWDNDSGFEYLVLVEGFLVPIPHIKAVGWVEDTAEPPDYVPDDRTQYYFRVHLDQPVSNAEDPTVRDLAAFFESKYEAEKARMDLARRVDEYYRNLQVNFAFNKNMQ